MARFTFRCDLHRLIIPTLAFCVLLGGVHAHAEDWSSLRSEYDQLKRYMAAKRTIGTNEKDSLIGLQSKLDAFRETNPNDPRPVAMDLQVAIWLGDDQRIDEDYERLASLSDRDRVQVEWARHRLGQNRYQSIPMILQADPIDLAAEPEGGILLARAHMSRNQFAEAIAAIDSIPEDGLAKPGIRGQATRIRGEATRWSALWQDESALREAEDAAGTAPIIQLITSKGPVTIMLFENEAPNTVANFIELAEQDFFDGTRFHRVEPNFVAQGGDPNSRPGSTSSAGAGGRGTWIPDESGRVDKRFHFAGSVAMAKSPDPSKPGRSIPNSASSQFYIVLEPAENLNQEYTVFGRVIDGIEVAEAIRRDEDLLEVATISRPERDYVAETLPTPGPIPTPAVGPAPEGPAPETTSPETTDAAAPVTSDESTDAGTTTETPAGG
jgi:cyclophilin family peptidyl-prolyl cis-trans isomerase